MRVVVRTVACVLLLISLALSGCSSKDNDSDPTTSSSSRATSTSGTQTTSTSQTTTTSGSSASNGPVSTANQAPTATLSASIQQGSIPFNVTFTMGGNDLDGDALTWTLDANDDQTADADGTTLPAEFTYQYNATGLYNITFKVSDGKDSTTQSLLVNATGAAAGAGVVQEYAGEWPVGGFGCALIPGADGSIYEDVFAVVPEVDPATVGQTYSAVFTTTPDTQEVFVYFRDEAFGGLDGGGSVTAAPWTVTGTVPEGAAFIVFTNCGALGASVAYKTPA